MVAAVTTATTATAKTDAARTSLATNFDTFLTLLTAQLKNQDPLSPMDSSQFTQQLTQMTGVQQQLLTNDLLTSLLAGQQSNLGGASNYIGKDVTAVWAADKLTDGKANWSYELATDATSAKLDVLDSTGKVVWSGPGLGPDPRALTTSPGTARRAPADSFRTAASTPSRSPPPTPRAPSPARFLTRGQATGVEMYDGVPPTSTSETPSCRSARSSPCNNTPKPRPARPPRSPARPPPSRPPSIPSI